MDNQENKFIDLLVSEYTALREEIRMSFQFQFAIFTILMAFLGVAFGFVFTGDLGDTINSILLSFIIPGICSFFGVMWLDLSMRIGRTAYYIRQIEEKMPNTIDDHKALGWETFVKNESVKIFKIPTNYIYHFISLGSILIMPYFICVIEYFIKGLPVNLGSIGLYFATLSTTAFFSTIEIKQILLYNNELIDLSQIEEKWFKIIGILTLIILGVSCSLVILEAFLLLTTTL